MTIVILRCALLLAVLQSQKLNGPLPSDPGTGGGDVRAFRLSPDETRFAYVADQDTADVLELYVGPLDGSSTPWKVSGALSEHGVFIGHTACFSPDGEWLVYLAETDGEEALQIYSAPADGSEPSRRLNGPLIEGGEVRDYYLTAPFKFTEDSSRVVYVADEDVDERFELYSAPIDGGAPAVPLCGALQPSGDVERFSPGYEIAPGGGRVAFVADRDVDEMLELYSVPIDGSAPPVQLNGVLGPQQDVDGEPGPDFRFTPDGSRVLYRADQDFDDVVNLYSVPADGSGAPRAVASLTSGGRDVLEFAISAQGRVVFRADLAVDNVFELFSAPPDFLSPPDRISGSMVAEGDVEGVLDPTQDGRVVYRADALVDDKFELFCVSLIDRDPPLRVSAALPPGRDVKVFRLERGGAYVVYQANPQGYDELFAAPLDGHDKARRVSGPLVEPRQVQNDFQAVNGLVVFRSGAAGVFELYAAPLEGWPPQLWTAPGMPPVPLERPRGPLRLHPALPTGSSIERDDFALTSSGLAILRSDIETRHQSEVFAVSATRYDTPRKLNAPLTAGPAEGDVRDFLWSNGRVVYSGTQRAAGLGELFTVVPDEAPDFQQIVELSTYGCFVLALQLTPDESRAVYVGSDATPGLYELYSVPVDGSAPPVKLNTPIGPVGGDVHEEFVIAPDGTKVVFTGTLVEDDVIELWVAPVDGSAPSQRLHPQLQDLHNVQSGMQVSSDSERAVYRADALVDERFDLYSAPLDAGAPPVRLDSIAIADGDVLSFRVSPDATFVVYVADQQVDQRFELFRVPIDGSQPPLRLNQQLETGGLVRADFHVTPDSARVVFTALANTLAGAELYVVPSDGNQAPSLLHPQHLFSDGIGATLLQPSGERVVYIEFEDPHGAPGLFSVPVDGSEPPLAIAPREAGPYAQIEELVLAPDGNEVLYLVLEAPGVKELYQASVLAGHAPFEVGGLHDATHYEFTPDGQHVLVRTSSVANGTVQLYAAPADGSAGLALVNDALVAGGNVTDFRPLPDGASVLYRADQDEDEVFELYLAPLP